MTDNFIKWISDKYNIVKNKTGDLCIKKDIGYKTCALNTLTKQMLIGYMMEYVLQDKNCLSFSQEMFLVHFNNIDGIYDRLIELIIEVEKL